MIVFKCKMCGGEMELEEGAPVAECPYCLTKQTLPKLDNDKRANMYDRANHFRRQNEYDKAMAIFESILQEDRTDAEAYWSLVLCRYGIEYVEDPATHKRVPTVNRVQYTSILADEDYKSALEYADFPQRSVYESEAKAIDEIQKGILAISKQEKPFDVFICYKETDANGRRTPDSVLANDLYHQLTNEGFKVFFSRITLEDKIGTAYEPYIFAALNSAKVMVVLGTKPEYFNAVWVKNEWSRYLALIRAGADKTLVPAYRDMDPYDLPDEFSHLQAQDMSKLGFMQDLIRGIKKLTTKDTPKVQTVVQQTVGAGANVENLMKRVRLFLEDSNFSSADEYLDRVLDENAEYAPAYIGKVLVRQKLRKEEELGTTLQQYEQDANWSKALRFATPELKEKYEGYLRSSLEKRKEKDLSDRYSAALSKLVGATTVAECNEAKTKFRGLIGYRDSEKKIDECDKKATQIMYDKVDQKRVAILREPISVASAMKLREVAKEFRDLGNVLDAPDKAKLCLDLSEKHRATVFETASKKLDSAQSVADVETAEKSFKELGYGYSGVSEKMEVCNKKKEFYRKVEPLDIKKWNLEGQKPSLKVAKQYDDLAKEYKPYEETIGNQYRSTDCIGRAEQIRSQLYKGALDKKNVAKSESDFDNAASLFKALESYKDSESQERACRAAADDIRNANRKAAIKKHITKIIIVAAIACCIAIVIFVTQYIIPKGAYGQAEALLAEGKYEEASAKFAEMGNRFDAQERVNEPFYVWGTKLYEQGEYTEAQEKFIRAGDYKDAATMANKCMYEYGNKLYSDQNIPEAILAFQKILGYEDATEKYENLNYEYGMSLYNSGNEAAAIIPLTCSGRPDSIALADDLREAYSNRVCIASSSVLAIKDDGTVLACGDNSENLLEVDSWRSIKKLVGTSEYVIGLMEDGNLCYNVESGWYTRNIVDLDNWQNVKDIVCNGRNIAVIHNNGTVSCVDINSGSRRNSFYTGGWSNIIQVSVSNYNVTGLTSGGTVVSTGNNEHSQMSSIGSFSNITSISTGVWKIVGVTKDGNVMYSGWTDYGEENVETWTNMKKVINGGSFFSVGLKKDGTVVATSDFKKDYGDRTWTPAVLNSWRDIVDVVSNGDDLVIGLKKDGTVLVAGEMYSSISKKSDYATDIDEISSWRDIIAIFSYNKNVVGLKSDGTLVYTGNNEFQQSTSVSSWKLWE